MIRRVFQFAICALVIPNVALAQARKPAAAAPTRLVLAPTGNLARFIVREKLIANTIENDAIGTTTAISGMVVIDGKGKGADQALQNIRGIQDEAAAPALAEAMADASNPRELRLLCLEVLTKFPQSY